MKVVVFVSLCILLSAAFECGVKKITPRLRRVVNGEKSYAGEWPWLGTIYKKTHNGPDRYLCGATLISEWALVTGEC